MAEIILTEENFDTEVLSSDIPVLVDFFATWCGPCMMLAPIIEQIAEEYDGKVKVAKLDVDTSPSIAVRYGVESIPTLFVFKDGDITAKMLGYRSAEEIRALLD